MFTKFWEGLTEGLGERWSAQEFGAALLFWFGGAIAWAWHEYSQIGWGKLTAQVQGIQDPAVYVALTAGGLALLSVSSLVAHRLQLVVLRAVEGYWPWPLRKARSWLAGRAGRRLVGQEDRWQALADLAPEGRTAAEQAEYARLDALLASYPVAARRLMPTRVGNLLRAAEEYPEVRYGLVTGVCWPRLWLVLPEGARTALSEARQQLNGAVRLFFWGLLFVVWTAWAWWAALVALSIVAVAYGAMVQAAGVYGDLLRAAFDLHRFALYEALRLPVPSGPEGEEAHGQRLSEYLFRGTARQDLRFVVPES